MYAERLAGEITLLQTNELSKNKLAHLDLKSARPDTEHISKLPHGSWPCTCFTPQTAVQGGDLFCTTRLTRSASKSREHIK